MCRRNRQEAAGPPARRVQIGAFFPPSSFECRSGECRYGDVFKVSRFHAVKEKIHTCGNCFAFVRPCAHIPTKQSIDIAIPTRANTPRLNHEDLIFPARKWTLRHLHKTFSDACIITCLLAPSRVSRYMFWGQVRRLSRSVSHAHSC